MQDLPNAVRERLYFLRFEDLVGRPAACMSHVFSWLGLTPWDIDSEKLTPMGPSESDSHYRMKYPHTQSTRMSPPPKHDVPARIQSRIEETYRWYYQLYYPSAGAAPG